MQAGGPPTRGTAHSAGRSLAWVSAGTGLPAVLLEAGLSGSSAGWAAVMTELSGTTRVVAYDRAGYGLSDPVDPRPEQVVADLRAVLAAAQVHGPVVLVGHSWGGPLVRLLAAAHPADVAAVVLLDATHEDLAGVGSRLLRRLNALVAAVQERRARSGRLRRQLEGGRGQHGKVLARVPEQHRQQLLDHLARPQTWQQTAREVRSIDAILAALPPAPPAVPVLAVVGGLAAGARQGKQRNEVRAVYEGWLGADRVVVVPESGHMLPLDAPSAVARIVGDAVRGLRGRSG